MQCISYEDDGNLQILDASGELLEHLNLPTEGHLSDIASRIKATVDEAKRECLVTVQKWGDKEQIILVREGNEM